MKKTLAFILLAASLLSAQSTTHKKPCLEDSEMIPRSAVEPVKIGDNFVCPRSEYKLNWFVHEETRVDSDYYPAYSGGYYMMSGGSTNVKMKTVLVFKPMCILKEAE